jgi:hypothetical protein
MEMLWTPSVHTIFIAGVDGYPHKTGRKFPDFSENLDDNWKKNPWFHAPMYSNS